MPSQKVVGISFKLLVLLFVAGFALFHLADGSDDGVTRAQTTLSFNHTWIGVLNDDWVSINTVGQVDPESGVFSGTCEVTSTPGLDVHPMHLWVAELLWGLKEYIELPQLQTSVTIGPNPQSIYDFSQFNLASTTSTTFSLGGSMSVDLSTTGNVAGATTNAVFDAVDVVFDNSHFLESISTIRPAGPGSILFETQHKLSSGATATTVGTIELVGNPSGTYPLNATISLTVNILVTDGDNTDGVRTCAFSGQVTVLDTSPASPVGGVAGLLESGESPVDSTEATGQDYAVPLAAAVASVVLAVGAGGWYARRRWMR